MGGSHSRCFVLYDLTREDTLYLSREETEDGVTSRIWQTIRDALHIIYFPYKIKKVRECMAAIKELENGELVVVVQIISDVSTDEKRLRPKAKKTWAWDYDILHETVRIRTVKEQYVVRPTHPLYEKFTELIRMAARNRKKPNRKSKKKIPIDVS
jgi:hypothetical protein